MSEAQRLNQPAYRREMEERRGRRNTVELSPRQIATARSELADGVPMAELARRFGTKASTLKRKLEEAP